MTTGVNRHTGVGGSVTYRTPGNEYPASAQQRITFEWSATPGEHELACRATDAAGHVQPLEAPWNYQGMGNKVVQRIPATVR